MKVTQFTFNEFQENTFVLHDSSKECVIIDPGCNNDDERNELANFINKEHLTVKKLINTHCHIDHVLGNHWVSEQFGVDLESHRGEKVVLDMQVKIAEMYGLHYTPSPPIKTFWEEGDFISFGTTKLEVIFTPGHSPASISLYHKESKQIIAGDVLFYGSIGRTDLPGGNYDELIKNIKTKILSLGDDIIVYPGHGPKTMTGFEKKNNQFLS